MWSENPELNTIRLIEKVRVLEERILIMHEDMIKQQYYIDLLLEKVLDKIIEIPIAYKIETD